MILKYPDFSKEESEIILRSRFGKPFRIPVKFSDVSSSYIDYYEGAIYISKDRSEREKRMLIDHELGHLSFRYHEPLWHYFFKQEYKKEEFVQNFKEILRKFPNVNLRDLKGLIQFTSLVFPNNKSYFCNLFEDLRINEKLRDAYPEIDQITGFNELIDSTKEAERDIRKMSLKTCGDPAVFEKMYKMIFGKMSIGAFFNMVGDAVVCISKGENLSSFLSDSVEHLEEVRNDVLDSIAGGIFRKSVEHRFKLEYNRLKLFKKSVDELDSEKVYNIIRVMAPNLRKDVGNFVKGVLDCLLQSP